MLLRRADTNRYGELLNELEKGTYLDQDKYPTTVAGMYKLMTKVYNNIIFTPQGNRQSRRRQGIALVQQGTKKTVNNELVPGTDG